MLDDVDAKPKIHDRLPRCVVGIGASAGGIDALRALVGRARLPDLALVVVQHLSATHVSVLTSLLSQSSGGMRVETACDGMRVERDVVYVLPPAASLTINGGILCVTRRDVDEKPHRPIDTFMQSLAKDQGSSAAGVVLSGTGSDGTEGLRAIKQAGGITFVQEPSSARHEGMPRSALASGFVDYCLSAEAIADHLAQIGQGRRPPPVLAPSPLDHADPEPFALLLTLLRERFAIDLEQYRRATLERRVERRMVVIKVAHIRDYVRYVQQHPEELATLNAEILINVTSFFRDPSVFSALEEQVLPRLLEQTSRGHVPLRVWVPASSTGEEAYSIAMLLSALVERTPGHPGFVIFATDLDAECVASARRGVYRRKLVEGVSSERLERFFEVHATGYQINRRLRDMVVFATHDVLRDVPFSHIDLVSCRNMLIYLQPPAQKRALRALHYALKPGGVLLLGSSEVVGDAHDLFSVLDRKHKLYEKRSAQTPRPERMAAGARKPEPAELLSRGLVAKRPATLQAAIDAKLVELYSPPSVVINADREVLHFCGQTTPYLHPAAGTASLNLLRLVRPELHVALKRCTEQAWQENCRTTTRHTYRDGEQDVSVRVDCVPMLDPRTQVRLLLVAFVDRVVEKVASSAGEDESASPAELAALRRELGSLQEYMQLLIEERDASLHELHSSNELLLSANEELQSTNEELDTSKEEMQSTNEELTTLNEELEVRMNELSDANDDLQNALAGVESAVLIVSLDGQIRRYSVAAEKLFGLGAADVGRSVACLDGFFRGIGLRAKTDTVIESLSPLELDVQAENGRWYALRISPYQTTEHTIRGAVVLVRNIDTQKRVADLTRNIGTYADEFLAAVLHPLLIVDSKLRIVWASPSFYEVTQHVPEETVGNLFTSLKALADTNGKLREVVLQALAGSPFRDFEMGWGTAVASAPVVHVGGRCIPLLSDGPLVLLSFEAPPPVLE